MSDTKISWSNKVWNPTTGCDRVSPGCDNCYAMTLAKRLKRMGNPRYQNDGDPRTSGPGFGLTLHVDKLEEPLSWKKPVLVFVNSMSDLFHDDVPDEFIVEVFAVMALASQHRFQVLTKRPRRMRSLLRDEKTYGPALADTFEARVGRRAMQIARDRGEQVGDPWWDAFWDWPLPNVWLGTSVEDQKRAELRVPLLQETPAAVRFLSCEPLLGPVDLEDFIEGMDTTEFAECGPIEQTTPGLHWVIVGGESGPNFREMNPAWARVIRDQCVDAGVPFFYKQGSGPRSEMHKELDGRTWDEMPEAVSV